MFEPRVVRSQIMSWFGEHLILSLLLISVIISLPVLYANYVERKQLSRLRSILKRWWPSAPSFLHNDASEQEKGHGAAPSSVSYKTILPPSSREGLRRVWKTLPEGKRFELRNDLPDKALQASVLPFESDYRTCDPSKYTAMGVSVVEIRELGEFPDYAALTDVPLPEPYNDFRIETAITRPYRPFRWAYHQTMCKMLAWQVATSTNPVQP